MSETGTGAPRNWRHAWIAKGEEGNNRGTQVCAEMRAKTRETDAQTDTHAHAHAHNEHARLVDTHPSKSTHNARHSLP